MVLRTSCGVKSRQFKRNSEMIRKHCVKILGTDCCKCDNIMDVAMFKLYTQWQNEKLVKNIANVTVEINVIFVK